MTIWSPRLPDSPEPIYRRIADVLERDIRAGVLMPGSQLPTHRDLARTLGITAVTVTRAYSESARRGLVESSTGRGTFVRAVRRDAAPPSAEIDLATNHISVPFPPPSSAALQRAASMLATTYGTGAGTERHRAAGAKWLGGGVDPSRVVVTAGTQHALLLAFAATARAGETILCESVTYHGAKAAAALLGLRLEPVAIDRFGLVPAALERAARARSGRVVYLIPSLHNPTGVTMPEKRRRDLAAVAAKHGLTLIEDDICGFLLEKTPPPLATFAPDRTISITGLGKALAPAVRVGFLAAPEALLPRVHGALAASILFATPIVAELAATWIEDGTAARLIAQKRLEITRRNAAARRILGPHVSGDPRSPHLWLELPKRWTADAFTEEARRRRVRLASASSFAVGRDVPRAVRVSVGAAPTLAELETALQIVASIEDERVEEPVV
ncbi:MAG: PLP-dependent aminotransferase family protein [Acidobacteria bacterium]|nr:PLP-dependent aminotransferase family protein [Acidobacteriota bacterium]MBV9476170.1 PLP-dependent aminotransferase family protein [Acidobacteriota bacterium]